MRTMPALAVCHQLKMNKYIHACTYKYLKMTWNQMIPTQIIEGKRLLNEKIN